MKRNFFLEKSDLLPGQTIVSEIDDNSQITSSHYVSTIMIECAKKRENFDPRARYLIEKLEWLNNNHPELLL